MSANLITHHEVIPEFDSDIFEGHKEAQLAVGVLAVGSMLLPGREEAFHAYGMLRGNTYRKQKGYRDVKLLPDGTEFDSDDERAIHLGIFENIHITTRAVGSMRMIIKSDVNPEPLPVEHHYPEAFSKEAAPARSVEISRWIGRHEDPVVQNKLKWPLFTAAVKLILDYELDPTYGVVEPKLARNLRRIGVPVVELSDAREMPGVRDAKQAIQIDVGGLAQNIKAATPDAFDAIAAIERGYAYSGVVPLLSAKTPHPRMAVA